MNSEKSERNQKLVALCSARQRGEPQLSRAYIAFMFGISQGRISQILGRSGVTRGKKSEATWRTLCRQSALVKDMTFLFALLAITSTPLILCNLAALAYSCHSTAAELNAPVNFSVRDGCVVRFDTGEKVTLPYYAYKIFDDGDRQ